MTQGVAQKNIFVEPRQRLIEWVRQQLIGPPEPNSYGPDLVGVLPTERFPCGVNRPGFIGGVLI